MSIESNYDVSVDYNVLVSSVGSIKAIQGKCSNLISALSAVDVSILDSAGLMDASINIVEGVMSGPIQTVLSRVSEVEALFNMFQSQEFYTQYLNANGEFDMEKMITDILSSVETQESCFTMVEKYDLVLAMYDVKLREIQEQIDFYERQESLGFLSSVDFLVSKRDTNLSEDSKKKLEELEAQYSSIYQATSLVNTLRNYAMDAAFYMYGSYDDFATLSSIPTRIARYEVKNVTDFNFYDSAGNLIEVSDAEAAVYFANIGKNYSFGELGDLSHTYSYLTEEEKKVANYLANTGNVQKLEQYFAFKEDYANMRHGEELAKEVTSKIDSYYVGADTSAEKALAYTRTLSLLATDGFSDGLFNFVDGISNLFTADGVVSAEQYKTSFLVDYLSNKYDDSQWSEIIATGAYEISTSLGNMAPSMALGFLTGCPLFGSASMGLSAVGSSREQGLQSGMNEVQAWIYGSLAGASEMTLEYFIGGIPGLSKLDDVAKLPGFKGFLAKMGSEALEESTQSLAEPLFNTMVTGQKYEVDMKEVLKSGIYGAITAGITNGGQMVIGKTIYSMKNMDSKFLADLALKYETEDLTDLSTQQKLHSDLAKYQVRTDNSTATVTANNSYEVVETVKNKTNSKNTNSSSKLNIKPQVETSTNTTLSSDSKLESSNSTNPNTNTNTGLQNSTGSLVESESTTYETLDDSSHSSSDKTILNISSSVASSAMPSNNSILSTLIPSSSETLSYKESSSNGSGTLIDDSSTSSLEIPILGSTTTTSSNTSVNSGISTPISSTTDTSSKKLYSDEKIVITDDSGSIYERIEFGNEREVSQDRLLQEVSNYVEIEDGASLKESRTESTERFISRTVGKDILKDFYQQMSNVMDNPKTIKKLIDIYVETTWGGGRIFYNSLVSAANPGRVSTDINIDMSNMYHSKMFNEWKSSFIHNYEVGLIEKTTGNNKLYSFLKNRSDVSTMDEIYDVYSDVRKDSDLYKAFDKKRWNSLDNEWVHVDSKYTNAENGKRPKVKHRLYLAVDRCDVHEMATYLVDKFNQYKLPFYFKFSELSDVRDDRIVLYADSKQLPSYLEVLREIKAEHPELVSKFANPPLLTGNIDGWIGYGSELSRETAKSLPGNIPNSYNMIRSHLIYDSIDKVTNKYILDNLTTKGKVSGKTMQQVITELFVKEKITSLTKEYNSLLEYYKKKEGSSFDENSIISMKGYSLTDINSLEFRKALTNAVYANLPNLMADRCNGVSVRSVNFTWNNQNFSVDSFTLRDVVHKFAGSIKNPAYIENIKTEIKNNSSKYGSIDQKNICFNAETVSDMKSVNREINASFEAFNSIINDLKDGTISVQSKEYISKLDGENLIKLYEFSKASGLSFERFSSVIAAVSDSNLSVLNDYLATTSDISKFRDMLTDAQRSSLTGREKTKQNVALQEKKSNTLNKEVSSSEIISLMENDLSNSDSISKRTREFIRDSNITMISQLLEMTLDNDLLFNEVVNSITQYKLPEVFKNSLGTSYLSKFVSGLDVMRVHDIAVSYYNSPDMYSRFVLELVKNDFSSTGKLSGRIREFMRDAKTESMVKLVEIAVLENVDSNVMSAIVNAIRKDDLAYVEDALNPDIKSKFKQTLSSSLIKILDSQVKESVAVLEDGEYELQDGERLNIGTQLFANKKGDSSIESVIKDDIEFLSQSKIKVDLNNNWFSDNGVSEVNRVKNILSNQLVFEAIATNKYGNYAQWLKYFDSDILNNPENIKLIARYNIDYITCVSSENLNNISLMRECAAQDGISPLILDFVGDNVRNDSIFITNLVKNCSDYVRLSELAKYYNINLDVASQYSNESADSSIVFENTQQAKDDSSRTVLVDNGISNFFRSDFTSAISPLKSYFEKVGSAHFMYDVQGLIDYSLKYAALFSDSADFSGVDFSQFVNEFLSFANIERTNFKGFDRSFGEKTLIYDFLKKKLLTKFNLTEDSLSDINVRKQLVDYISKRSFMGNYKFHAFSSISYDGIREGGISPSANNTSQQDVDRMISIFNKYSSSNSLLFGYRKLNSEGTVFYSETPSVSYGYALRAPEWFAYFTEKLDNQGQHSFIERNYKQAKQNLLDKMERDNFSASDKSEVLDFFDKYWNLYTEGKPMLAIIPETDTEIKEISAEGFEWLASINDYDIDVMLRYALDEGEIDGRSNSTIDVSNAVFVELPVFKDVVDALTGDVVEDGARPKIGIQFFANPKTNSGTVKTEGSIAHAEDSVEIIASVDTEKVSVKVKSGINNLGAKLFPKMYVSSLTESLNNATSATEITTLLNSTSPKVVELLSKRVLLKAFENGFVVNGDTKIELCDVLVKKGFVSALNYCSPRTLSDNLNLLNNCSYLWDYQITENTPIEVLEFIVNSEMLMDDEHVVRDLLKYTDKDFFEKHVSKFVIAMEKSHNIHDIKYKDIFSNYVIENSSDTVLLLYALKYQQTDSSLLTSSNMERILSLLEGKFNYQECILLPSKETYSEHLNETDSSRVKFANYIMGIYAERVANGQDVDTCLFLNAAQLCDPVLLSDSTMQKVLDIMGSYCMFENQHNIYKNMPLKFIDYVINCENYPCGTKEPLIYAVNFSSMELSFKTIKTAFEKGYCANSDLPDYIRTNSDMIAAYITCNDDSYSVYDIIDNYSRLTVDSVNESFYQALFNSNYALSENSPEFLRSNYELIMSSLKNIPSGGVDYRLRGCDLISLNSQQLDMVLEYLNSIEYHPSVNAPFDMLNIVLKPFVDSHLETLNSSYRATLDKVIEELGASVLYFEGYDGLFREDVLRMFGAESICDIYRYCDLVNNRIDFSELTEANVQNLKNIYDLSIANLKTASSFDINYFINLVNKYKNNNELFEQILNSNELSDDIITNLVTFVRSNFDIKVSSIDDLMRFDLLVKEHISSVIKKNDSAEMKNVLSLLLFNKPAFEIDEFFERVADIERVESLISKINDSGLRDVLRGYSVLFEFYQNNFDSDNLAKLLSKMNVLDYSEFLTFDKDISRFFRYCYGLEVNQTLTNLDLVIDSSGVNKRYTEKYRGNVTLEDGTSIFADVDYIEINSKYRFFQHTLNAYGSGGKLQYLGKQKNSGSSYICFSLIGDGKGGVYRTPRDIDHVSVLYDRINPNNFLFCSETDLSSYAEVKNSRDIKTKRFYKTDISDKILDVTGKSWIYYNEYTIYRDGLSPAAILVTGDVPCQAEIDAAATLGVPLVKINKNDINTAPTVINSNPVTVQESVFVDKVKNLIGYINGENSYNVSRKGIPGTIKNIELGVIEDGVSNLVTEVPSAELVFKEISDTEITLEYINNMNVEVVAKVIEMAINEENSILVKSIIKNISKNNIPIVYKYLLDSSSIKVFNSYLSDIQIRSLAKDYYNNPVLLNKFISNLNSVSVSKLFNYFIRSHTENNVKYANSFLSKLDKSVLQKLINDGSLNEYLGKLSGEEIKGSVLDDYVFQIADHGNLDTDGKSFVLLTDEQIKLIHGVVNSVKRDYVMNGELGDNTKVLFKSLDSKTAVVFISKAFNSKSFVSLPQEVVSMIDVKEIPWVVYQSIDMSYFSDMVSYLTDSQIKAIITTHVSTPSVLNSFFSNLSSKQLESVVSGLDNYSKYDNYILEIINNYVNASDICNIRKMIDDNKIVEYVEGLSDEELGAKIDSILSQNLKDVTDIADMLINADSDRVYEDMVIDGSIKYHEKLPDDLKYEILSAITNSCDNQFMRFVAKDGTYGIDQGEVRRHAYYVVKNSFINDINSFAEFIAIEKKMSLEKALELANTLSQKNMMLDADDYELISKYISLSDSYGPMEATKLLRDNFIRREDRVYKGIVNKLVKMGTDRDVATMILDSIDTTGVCSYASVANMLFNTYMDKPKQFQKEFGFKLYSIVNGKQEINSLELLADMYIYINSDLCGGSLFKISDGKITLTSEKIDTSKQIRISNSSGIKYDLVNKYLKAKNSSLVFETRSLSSARDINVSKYTTDNIRNVIARAMQEGKQVSLGLYQSNKEFRFLENGEVRQSSLKWNEGNGHAVFVTGLTKDGVIVSTWGERRTISFDDFIDNKFTINISSFTESSVNTLAVETNTVDDGILFFRRSKTNSGIIHDSFGINDMSSSIDISVDGANNKVSFASKFKNLFASPKETLTVMYNDEKITIEANDSNYLETMYRIQAKAYQYTFDSSTPVSFKTFILNNCTKAELLVEALKSMPQDLLTDSMKSQILFKLEFSSYTDFTSLPREFVDYALNNTRNISVMTNILRSYPNIDLSEALMSKMLYTYEHALTLPDGMPEKFIDYALKNSTNGFFLQSIVKSSCPSYLLTPEVMKNVWYRIERFGIIRSDIQMHSQLINYILRSSFNNKFLMDFITSLDIAEKIKYDAVRNVYYVEEISFSSSRKLSDTEISDLVSNIIKSKCIPVTNDFSFGNAFELDDLTFTSKVTSTSKFGVSGDLTVTSKDSATSKIEDIDDYSELFDLAPSRKSILGITKDSIIERKLASYDSKTIDKMIVSGQLDEYIRSLSIIEINEGPLRKYSYQIANKFDLDARGDSFVLLTTEQRSNLFEFMESINDGLVENIPFTQDSFDIMKSMDSNAIVAAIDKLSSDEKYAETLNQVMKYISRSNLASVIETIMVRNDSSLIISKLSNKQIIGLLDAYTDNYATLDKFYRSLSSNRLGNIARILNDLRIKGNTKASNLYNQLVENIDFNLVREIKNRVDNNTLSGYLSNLSDTEVGDLIENVIYQKCSDVESITEMIFEALGPEKIAQMVYNGTLKFDVNFSKEVQNAMLEMINAQKDGKFRDLNIYGVDQGDVRKHVNFVVKYSWTDDISSLAKFLSIEQGYDLFKAESVALEMTSPNYSMDADDYQMVTKYLEKQYGLRDAMRILRESFVRKTDSRYNAVLNKLMEHGTSKDTATKILDCIDTTGVCSYASVANLIVDVYKNTPNKFRRDFGFDLYKEIDGHLEINSTELLADMYIYINSNLGGGSLFTINNGRVSLNTTIINTDKQFFLSGQFGFRTDLINKYLRSKNEKLSLRVASTYEFSPTMEGSEIDNLKTAIVRAMQEGKQISLGVYRTKNKEFRFLDANGKVKESTSTWSEGDGHAVYVTGVTNTGVVVSTWGKRRIIPFTDFVNNKYRLNFIEFSTNGRALSNKPMKIYSNPDFVKANGSSVVMDRAVKQKFISPGYTTKLPAEQEFVRNGQFTFDLFEFFTSDYMPDNAYCIITPNQMVSISSIVDGKDVSLATIAQALFDEFDNSADFDNSDCCNWLIDNGCIVIELNKVDGTNITIPFTVTEKQCKMLQEFDEQIKLISKHLDSDIEFWISGSDDIFDTTNGITELVDSLLPNTVDSFAGLSENDLTFYGLYDLFEFLNKSVVQPSSDLNSHIYLSKYMIFNHNAYAAIEQMGRFFGDAGEDIKNAFVAGKTVAEISSELTGLDRENFERFVNNTIEGKFLSKLTKFELFALKLYTRGPYDIINGAIRSLADIGSVDLLDGDIEWDLNFDPNNPEQDHVPDIQYFPISDVVKSIDTVIEKYGGLDDNMILYRGVDASAFIGQNKTFASAFMGIRDMKDVNALYITLKQFIGFSFHDYAYMSASPGYATSFAKDDNYPIVLEIVAPRGTKGAYINQISKFYNKENEFLFARDTDLEIVSVSKVKDFLKKEKVIVRCVVKEN